MDRKPILETSSLLQSATGRQLPMSKTVVARIQYNFTASSILTINGVITFSEAALKQVTRPHEDALVLNLEIKSHMVRRILVDLGSAADILYMPALL